MKPFEIKVIKTCESTNDLLIEYAKNGAKEGQSILSEKQTKGRGRYNSLWTSEIGNIFLSTLLKPSGNKKNWYQLSLLVGLSVYQSLLEIGIQRKDLKIKWPNDILLNLKKVCGVLIETIDNFVVIGIGINLKSHPKKIQGEFQATDLSLYHGLKVRKIDDISKIILDKIYFNYKMWNKESLITILNVINSNLAYKGQNIMFFHSENMLIGKLIGVDEKGFLKISSNKKEYKLITSENLFYSITGEKNVSCN